MHFQRSAKQNVVSTSNMTTSSAILVGPLRSCRYAIYLGGAYISTELLREKNMFTVKTWSSLLVYYSYLDND